MTQFYRLIDSCILCGSPQLAVVLPLQPIPVSSPNSRFLAESPQAQDQLAPLDLKQCGHCGHLQIASVVDPEFLYRHYLYRTAISAGLNKHFAGLADEVIARLGIAAGARIVEIGSNDGTQLRAFKDRRMSVLGVDPGSAIAAAANAAGIETIADFFTESLARSIAISHGPARLIVANNVIANIPDLAGAVRGVAALLDEDGAFVFETQYGADVVTGNLLDTIYHEHLSYFLVRPLAAFLAGCGLALVHVLRVPTKGGSIRVTARRAGAAVDPGVAAMIAAEERLGLYGPEIYRDLAARIERSRIALSRHVDAVRAAGGKIAGYGVSIGTCCQLHQFDLWRRIDFLVDDDVEKLGSLSGPGYEIPVRSPAALLAEPAAATVIFAWRYADRIMAGQADYRRAGGRFILPLPDFSAPDSGDNLD